MGAQVCEEIGQSPCATAGDGAGMMPRVRGDVDPLVHSPPRDAGQFGDRRRRWQALVEG
jgi:hypothetical protein